MIAQDEDHPHAIFWFPGQGAVGDEFVHDDDVTGFGCDVDHAFGDVVAVFDQAVLKEVPGAIKHAFVRAGDDEETPVARMYVGEIGEADGVVAKDASVADFVADGVPAEIVAGAVQAECFVDLIGDVDLKRAAGEAGSAIGEFFDDGPGRGVHGEAFECSVECKAVQVAFAVFAKALG